VLEGWEEGVEGGIKRRRAVKRDMKKEGVLEGWEECLGVLKEGEQGRGI